MKIKTVNEAPHAATAASPQKQVYKSPLLRVYGAVHQFTQGSGTTAQQDASIGMVKVQSDRACKTNLARVGTHPLNIGLYLFDYKPEFQASVGSGRHFGVMADEVETVMPEAVAMHADGFKRVNYAMLGIDLSGRRVH
ncbi:tail fiber domain-containing protein [Deinococcus sp.]|uniref:tail fiber domain-containing protein n=1 Tax=Deinococcus sp. TaxID=47478 RepID=UPI00286E273C|nr:tail fiber domain-containing protein [Deinococcus sp.]